MQIQWQRKDDLKKKRYADTLQEEHKIHISDLKKKTLVLRVAVWIMYLTVTYLLSWQKMATCFFYIVSLHLCVTALMLQLE
jgi:hypothetical protein